MTGAALLRLCSHLGDELAQLHVGGNLRQERFGDRQGGAILLDRGCALLQLEQRVGDGVGVGTSINRTSAIPTTGEGDCDSGVAEAGV